MICRRRFLGAQFQSAPPDPKPQGELNKAVSPWRALLQALLPPLGWDAFLRPATYQNKSLNVENKMYWNRILFLQIKQELYWPKSDTNQVALIQIYHFLLVDFQHNDSVWTGRRLRTACMLATPLSEQSSQTSSHHWLDQGLKCNIKTTIHRLNKRLATSKEAW